MHKIKSQPDDVSVSLLAEFANYILHNANWSESYAEKPWYSEVLDKNVNSEELVDLFLNSRITPI
jgi:hypothetical protein